MFEINGRRWRLFDERVVYKKDLVQIDRKGDLTALKTELDHQHKFNLFAMKFCSIK